MCGITGIWHLNGEQISEGKLEKFTDAIIERGPDGFGYEFFENRTLGLGHRRLSILDLSESGKQPMFYANDRYVITYNGEVFNFMEIRQKLDKLGYQFKTNTDTEVILAAYVHWGENCMHQFNGMWAFAIWDREEKELFVARDRFGIKPLYFLHIPGKVFAFSSETRSFKVLDGFQRQFNLEMVELSTEFTRIQGSGYSIYENIYQILPGHKASIRVDDKTVKQERWWHIYKFLRKDVPKKLSDQAQEYYELFRDACRLRLISDVPVGTALSGGLDSSSVYSTVFDILQKEQLQRFSPDSQRAFVATFPGLISDERQYAEEALKYTNGPAVFLEQTFTDLPGRIEKDTVLFDALGHAPITSISSIYRGMKENGIKVSLDGHGVDEMLYGYRDMIYNLFYHYFKMGNLRKAKAIRDVLIPTYHQLEQENAIKNLGMLIKKASSPLQRLKATFRQIFKNPYYFQEHYEQHDSLQGLGDPYDFGDLDYVDKMIFKETFVDTLPSLFRDFDRAGMINSVEIRMPFMDWRLLTYSFSLPFESKVGQGYNKLVLRESMKGKMAEGIRTRKHKIGIGSPVDHWFKTELKDWVMDHLHSKRFVESPVIAKTDLAQRMEDAYANKHLSREIIHEAWHEINLQLIK